MYTLIFLGGEPPSNSLTQLGAQRADFIIAADSGYDVVSRSGITPDIVTGDFDSIKEIPVSEKFRVIPATEQDATDFEKALRHVPAEARSVEILGGTGLRSDHFLTNLLIASNLPSSLAVVFHDDTQSIYRVTPEFSLTLNNQPGTIISLIPFSHCSGASTTGLHWNLNEAEMGPTAQLGQSNQADRETTTIRISDGTLFAVVNHPNGLTLNTRLSPGS